MHSMAPKGRQLDFMVVGASLDLEGVGRQVNGLALVVVGENMLLNAGDMPVAMDTNRVGGEGSPTTLKASFRDMVVGQIVVDKQNSFTGHFKDLCKSVGSDLEKVAPKPIPTADDMYGPWMQVERRRRRGVAVSRDVLPETENSPTVGGSRFAALANVEGEVMQVGDVNVRLRDPIISRPSLSTLAPLAAGGRMVARLMLAVLRSEITPNIAAKDTVVVAPTSLLADKHKAIRVVEEGSKKILHDNNGRAMYGSIRKFYSKGASRNVNLAAGFPRKNGKPKKVDGTSQKPIEVSKLIKNVTSELSTVSSLEGGEGRNNELVGGDRSSVHWIENTAFDGEREAGV
ncbi:hypothetical protein V6N13_135855 [Hibiscus sabdariffa]|uniref:Uncharacterized protein n=1 Tax=Hibiscus sabdariffa TaxID=183260 RepID=A0ABR2QSR9_9ROSI